MNLIEAKNIEKTFLVNNNQLQVLKNVSIKINNSESISIVGLSGAGKSTLLHLLGLLDIPTNGEILFDGVNVSKLNDDEQSVIRNNKIGFVFQFHHLLPEFTILENVIMPSLISNNNYNISKNKGLELLEIVGLTERINHRPNELSGGEQQRAAVARALINNPSILLADEPTGNLDSHNAELVHSLLFKFQKENKMSLVIVTHNIELSKQTNRRITLIDGEISKEETL